jgi:hypothetical protein
MQFEFKQGVVTATRKFDPNDPNGGSLYQMRVQPDMVNIPATDMDLLPWYPNFFKGDHTAYQKDDAVWLLVNDDFHVGFILGGTQSASGDDISTFISIINNAEVNAGLQKSDYDQIDVTQFGGASVSFSNRVTGQAGVIYNNKIICIYGSDGSMWYNNPGLTATVSPDGDLNIKGRNKIENYAYDSIVTTNDSTETVGTKRIDSDGKMTLTAGGTFEKHVSSANTEWVGGDDNRNILGKKLENVVGNETVNALGGISLNAGTPSPLAPFSININPLTGITITSASLISLICSALNINAAGSVAINSASLALNAASIGLNSPIVTWGISILTPGGAGLSAGASAFVP